MADAPRQQPAKQVRSTRQDFDGPGDFASTEEALAYYKAEYSRLKAIIALQKGKIRKLVAVNHT
ncbi:MAG: hypothetical protein B193_0793 [Solidesulfovibrio magneticus str. Maddingley MBC34]|uniref:Uncharacterized protein n=1 Tax=Solidesulfovibrio magneticus str. Maddingley MBC34 TaxID=1206767 RepID=K6HDF9_9BACT|nr:MAG: hypothetical protein B193_0793 [Solidesulfovibrio magneticus str. Maddingley MBC34]